jgi:hypothetical protein
MFRDSRRDKDYFDTLLGEYQEGLQEISQSFQKGEYGSIAEEMEAAFEYWEQWIYYCLACYTQGHSLEALKPKVAKILDARKLYTAFADNLPEEQKILRESCDLLAGEGDTRGSQWINRYVNVLRWIALAVLTGQDDFHIRQIFELVGNKNQDRLLDYLAYKLLPDWGKLTDKVLYPDAYGPLLQAIDGPAEEASEKVKAFLDGWYEAMDDTDWIDNHECEIEFGYWDYYVGYWAVEAALVVKVFGINDELFWEQEYYPRYLVHGRDPENA